MHVKTFLFIKYSRIKLCALKNIKKITPIIANTEVDVITS